VTRKRRPRQAAATVVAPVTVPQSEMHNAGHPRRFEQLDLLAMLDAGEVGQS